ncbi:T9SS type A sorting domain-containing protein [Flavobacterium sp. 7A]|uniref:T9SS type A sorting domain-containing protein n=1 Tax=Flavobacterium sp. 7A TaxID=2940571 RepID=UPI0022276103|nr:T9SS type A sorting domain-containing protein [Flavobacterium sp. 7A]MCW2118480.1 hypothetical protein [Flavobacterium sp. 7A]
MKYCTMMLLPILFGSFAGFGQNNSGDVMENIITSGSNAESSSGSVAYSIGQVFYTYVGESIYGLAQGVQHNEVSATLLVPSNVYPSAEIVIFPNPTTDYVSINMTGVVIDKTQSSYQLYDTHGRILKQNSIKTEETQINVSDLSSAVYLLQVVVDNDHTKTFKIVKN